MIRVKPTVNGWELIKNTRSEVIYKAAEIGLSIFLMKISGVWKIEYDCNGEVISKDEAPLKENAVSKAKGFMHENPVVSDTVPVLLPGEEFHFDSGKFKRPGRVTQFSKHRR